MEIFLRSSRTRTFRGYHPWVMDGSIVEPSTPLEAGQIVELVNVTGGWIGRGIYNPHSRIRVRMYQWRRDSQLDQAWFEEQLDRAQKLRLQWMIHNRSLDAVRWINSEGDGLSGLVVDQFGKFFVIQINAASMLRWESALIDWIKQKFDPQGIILRIDANTAKAEGIPEREELVYGELTTDPIEVADGDLRIQLDLQHCQKTGYYLDQRSNRIRAAHWMGSGPMLDVCCYLGGFSFAASRIAKPSTITAVDSSMNALKQAEANAQLNQIEVDWVQADCFDYLSDLVDSKNQFETIVLDPPRMAGHRGQLQNALRAYHRLNLNAVRLLKPGGILVTCSCSGRISRHEFTGILGSVAQRSRRSIQIIESLGADFDHPISTQCPESEYLKCFICRVF
jgi:23S rRNA (cytosine1962-C5)-methyltransferase